MAQRKRLAQIQMSRLGRILLTLLLMTSAWPAQEFVEVARARNLAFVEAGPNSIACYQVGFQLQWVRHAQGKMNALARLTLPATTTIYDLKTTNGEATVFVMGEEGVYGRVVRFAEPSAQPWIRIADGGDLFRGRLDLAPRRQRFSIREQSGDFCLVRPELKTLSVLKVGDDFRLKGQAKKIAAPARAEQKLGWGLGYRMRVRIVPPYYSLSLDTKGSAQVLYRSESSWRLWTADEKDQKWSAAPAKEDHRLIDFDMPVPPFVGSLGVHKNPDILLTDPGSGTFFVSRGIGRPAKDRLQPDQVLRLSGWVLGRWLLDANDDGRPDLIVASVPKLNLLEQVAVLKNQSVPFRISVRLQGKDGRFSESTVLKHRGRIGVELVITRTRRSLRFRDPLRLLTRAKDLFLVAPDGDELSLFRAAGKKWEKVRDLARPGGKGAVYLNPFGPAETDQGPTSWFSLRRADGVALLLAAQFR